MVKLKILNKDNEIIRELDLKEEDLVNKRFKRKESILDILLNNKVDQPFGCMGGSCSACVCAVVSGNHLVDNEGLHPQIYKGIESNQILTCIATIKDEATQDDVVEIKQLF